MQIELSPADLVAVARAVADELTRRGAIATKLDPERIAYPEREAARLLGIPWYSLRNLRLAGEIKARRLGRSYVYSRDALIRYLEGGDE